MIYTVYPYKSLLYKKFRMVANLEYCIDLMLGELDTLPDIDEESTIKTSTQVSEKANSISSDIQSMCSDF